MPTFVERIVEFTDEVGAQLKEIRTLVNGNAETLASLNFGTKQNVTTSLNELKSFLDGVGDQVTVLNNNKANQEAFESLLARVGVLETNGGTSNPILYPALDFRDARNSMYA